jgi:hypothetical protein
MPNSTDRDRLITALGEALQDEYKARATYRQIIQRFGPVRPFINIVNSEERHIRALLTLFHRYQIPVPADTWPGRVTIPDSVAAACQEGVVAEIENGELYNRLLEMTQLYPDVQQVFRNLQRASQQNHLRAFQRGAAWTTMVESARQRQDRHSPAQIDQGASGRGRSNGARSRHRQTQEGQGTLAPNSVVTGSRSRRHPAHRGPASGLGDCLGRVGRGGGGGNGGHRYRGGW